MTSNQDPISVTRERVPQGAPPSCFVKSAAPLKKLPWTLNLLLVYLASITIFGKGPTYIGVPPVYWGEVILAFSLLWALRTWNRISIRTLNVRILTAFVCIFMALGVIEAIRDYPDWGIDTLRDSALWYYGLFYFIGLAIAAEGRRFRLFLSRWKLFWIIAVPWGSIELLGNYRLSALSPMVAGRFPVLASWGLELAQSVGIGCILLLNDDRSARFLPTFPRVGLAAVGLAACIYYEGRGARLAALTAFLISLIVGVAQGSFGRSLRRKVLLAVLLLGGAAAVATTAGTDLIDKFSLNRFEGASLDNPDATAEWREVWWDRLYAGVMDTNPMFGLGFGLNIADYNPLLYQDPDNPVRSPHNISVTVFSRMGIAGFSLWVGILVLGILAPFVKLLRVASPFDQEEVKARAFWIAVLGAILVNSSLSVLMEGPVMGIPFWLILGLLSGQSDFSFRQRTVYSASESVSSAFAYPRRVWAGTRAEVVPARSLTNGESAGNV